MTSQTLVPNRLPDLSNAQARVRHLESTGDFATASDSAAVPGSASPQANQLPYQASHRTELLHLQAETEALLIQLQTIKQQRCTSEDNATVSGHQPDYQTGDQ